MNGSKRKTKYGMTHQVDDAGWGSLLTAVLAKVEKALACVGRPGSIVVGCLCVLLTTQIAG